MTLATDTRKLTALRESTSDGTLPAYAWPGAYQMVYYTRDGGIICPPCANDPDYAAPADSPDYDPSDRGAVIAGEPYCEGPAIECDCPCEDRGGPHFIESAYGDDESAAQ